MLLLSAKLFRTNCLMGKHSTKGVSVNHSKDRSLRLVHWLHLTSHESINLERKCSLESSSAMYLLYAEGIWKEYILVADHEELEEMDASEIHAMVILPEMGEEFIFSVADGTVKPFGGDQALNTSVLIRNQPTRGESHHDFLGESEGSPPAQHFQDSYPDAGEARNDF